MDNQSQNTAQRAISPVQVQTLCKVPRTANFIYSQNEKLLAMDVCQFTTNQYSNDEWLTLHDLRFAASDMLKIRNNIRLGARYTVDAASETVWVQYGGRGLMAINMKSAELVDFGRDAVTVPLAKVFPVDNYLVVVGHHSSCGLVRKTFSRDKGQFVGYRYSSFVGISDDLFKSSSVVYNKFGGHQLYMFLSMDWNGERRNTVMVHALNDMFGWRFVSAHHLDWVPMQFQFVSAVCSDDHRYIYLSRDLDIGTTNKLKL